MNDQFCLPVPCHSLTIGTINGSGWSGRAVVETNEAKNIRLNLGVSGRVTALEEEVRGMYFVILISLLIHQCGSQKTFSNVPLLAPWYWLLLLSPPANKRTRQITR